MSLQDLISNWRQKEADYLRMASNMRCASMAEARSGYVGRAAFARMAAVSARLAQKLNDAPRADASRLVFAAWQSMQSHCRFKRSSEPPCDLGSM